MVFVDIKDISLMALLSPQWVSDWVCLLAGAHYFDNTSQKEKEDDVVQPNGEHTYYWEASPKVSPQPNDPTCLTYTYISHQQFVEDFNLGLMGALLICKPGKKWIICFSLSRPVAALWFPFFSFLF